MARVTTAEIYADTNDDKTMDSGELRAKFEVSYDELGRIYERVTYEVENGTTANLDTLTTKYWYDDRGRQIKVEDPNGAFLKNSYDGLGRDIARYLGFDSSETDHDEADDVDGDTVITQAEYAYNLLGLPTLLTNYLRHEAGSGTGELTTSNARRSYNARWYDDAGRLETLANYGTNGGSAFTYDPDSPPTPGGSVNILAYSLAYDSAGRQYESTDNKARRVRKEFNDLGRLTKITRNFENLDEEDWENDQITEFVYDDFGRLMKIRAVNVDDAESTTVNQDTYFVYGDDVDAGLVTDVIYPESTDDFTESSGGVVINSGADHVSETYDRLGQIETRTDQNETVHEYVFDSVGRLIDDSVTTVAAGIDGSVKRIEYIYDDFGRIEEVVSHDTALTGGTVVNSVVFDRADDGESWGNITTSWQEHSGSATTTTPGESPKVQYAYEDGAVNPTVSEDAKYNRLDYITYPDSRGIYYNYSSTGVGGALSRLDNIADDGAGTKKYAQFTYLGSNTLIKEAHPDVTGGFNLEYGDSGDSYAGLDRFGRIVDQNWVKDNDAGIDQYTYGYGGTSIPKYRENTLAPTGSKKDELYGYGGLDRLYQMWRGDLNGGKTGMTSTVRHHTYQLDSVGNWSIWSVDLDGESGNDLGQSRIHNRDNEIEDATDAIDEFLPGQVSWVDPSYDNAGNMTSGPRAGRINDGTILLHYEYDAWNRLAAVYEDDAGSHGDAMADYQYDGLNRRIVKIDKTGASDVRYDYYYNTAWQVLEVRKDQEDYAYKQYVWSPRYIDSPVVRFRDADNNDDFDETLYYSTDATHNVTALIDDSGVVVERYMYDPYGVVTVLDADWADDDDSLSDWDNEILFAGYRHDPETDLYHVRNRYHHSGLGRWMTRDPAGYVDGMNLYEYIMSTPTMGTDPFGLDCWLVDLLKGLWEAAKNVVGSGTKTAEDTGDVLLESVPAVTAAQLRRAIQKSLLKNGQAGPNVGDDAEVQRLNQMLKDSKRNLSKWKTQNN